MDIKLLGYPMPPSVNDLNFNNTRGYGPGRIKTSIYRNFERAVTLWAAKNQATLMMARDLTLQLDHQNAMRVDSIFKFYEKKILMKSDGKDPRTGLKARLKGEPKRNDTSNRLKAMDDSLASLLGIDDAWFWAGSYDKAPFPESIIPEHVDISISLHRIS